MATASTTSSDGNINVLVLGESGVGKSTFINAFANYLTFDELPTKSNHNLVSLIPTSFTMYDENDVERIISFGKESDDHSFAVGEAATRYPSCYEFPVGDQKIRIIDTPGIGDPRGINQDHANFENILMFISNFENLHCICILLKPNNARLNVTFDFCIKQLLCHLQKDASKNIVFVYTNSRSTFYKPGDTGPLLRKMLKDIENNPPYVNIPHDSNRVYCMDNEAFRFILAMHEGVKFDVEIQKDFSASWNKSAKECQRLMKYIIGCPEENVQRLPPHSIKATISLNKARAMILDLSGPLADIMDNVSLNIAILNKHKSEIEEQGESLVTLEKKLYIPIVKMEVVPFEKPQTACTSAACSEIQSVEGVQRYVNKTTCHNPCTLKNVSKEIIGHPELQFCEVMNYETGNCNMCGCSYTVHIHKYYGIREVAEKVIDKVVKTQLDSATNASKRANEILIQTKNRIADYTEEKIIVTKSMATFAHFLSNNAIICYNDAFIKYINYRIENLKALPNNDDSNGELVVELERMIQEYKRNIEALESAMRDANAGKSAAKEITSDDIIKTIDKLKKLPICGAKISEMHAAQDKMNEQEMQQRIVSVKGIHPNKMFDFIKTGYEKNARMLTAIISMNSRTN
ncbi:hypothetical protein CHUAL_004787 [Chamberlinius hualienensis]